MSQEEQQPLTGNRSLDMCRRTVTTESFIAEAKEIYGDRYDYSKVVYKNKEHMVTVVCPIHGDFKVYAREHLDGKGCPKCEKGEKFLEKLHEKFGDKFGLEQFVYDSSTTPVTLICPTHGAFSRLPHQILKYTFGCPECANQVKENAHAAAEERKAEQKRLKIKEAEQAKARIFAELDERLRVIKEDIHTWVCKPTKAVEKRLGVENAPWKLYQRLVDAHIDDIRYGSHAREEYIAPFLVAPEDAKRFPHFEEGDLLYRFPGEGPNLLFIERYDADPFKYAPSLTKFLEHRDCEIYFKGENLYILFKYSQYWSYKVQSGQITQAPPAPKQVSLPTSFVSIDFETLYAQRVSACSVGLVKYKDGKLVDHYYSLIRPPFDYEGKTGFALTRIHGFRESDLVAERTMESVLPEIEKFIGDLPLVAHNASVEKGCLRDTVAYYGLKSSLDYEHFFDTLYLSKDIEKQLGIYEDGEGTHTLDAVCRRFGVCEGKHHNALDDAEMCGNLILAFQAALDNGKVVPLNLEPIQEAARGAEKDEQEEGGGLFSFFKKIFGN